jgi:hypothetical protein
MQVPHGPVEGRALGLADLLQEGRHALGPDRAERDRVGADPPGPVVDRECPRQALDRGLRRRVRQGPANGPLGLVRRDVDDRARGARGPERPDRGGRTRQARPEVRPDQVGDRFAAVLVQPRVAEHRRVVDPPGERPEFRGRLHRLRRDLVPARVAHDRAGPVRRDERPEPVHRRGPQLDDHHAGAVGQQPLGDRPAHALSTARDDDDPAMFDHQRSSRDMLRRISSHRAARSARPSPVPGARGP